MPERERLAEILTAHGVEDHRPIDPAKIEVAHWVRMKCQFACRWYGARCSCPPHMPPLDECRAFLREYTEAILLHFAIRVAEPEQRHAATREINLRLLKVERDVFLAGHPKAFLFFIAPCNICEECKADPMACVDKTRSRPAPEGFGIDVFGMARQAGYEIEVLREYQQTMNRFGLLLVR